MSNNLTADNAFKIALETSRTYIKISHEMIRDANRAAHAKVTAAKQTNCRACQAALENFLLEYPDCSDDAISEQHHIIWEVCPNCHAEVVEVMNSWKCEHGNAAHHCVECLDAWADENAPECDEILDKPSDWEVQNGLS